MRKCIFAGANQNPEKVLAMKNRIYIKQWLELKPYKNPTGTDSYYLKLSNEIKNSFFYDENMLVFRFLNRDEVYFSRLFSGLLVRRCHFRGGCVEGFSRFA